MREFKAVVNVLLFLALIGLNLWLFSTETGYSIKKVSEELAQTRPPEAAKLKFDLSLYNGTQLPQKEGFEIERNYSRMDELIYFWQELKKQQNKLFEILPVDSELRNVFELEDKVVLNFEGVDPDSLSLIESYLFQKQVLDNFSFLARGRKLQIVFKHGLLTTPSRFLFNEI
ncbi:MAG: hypothetical protein PHW04_00125 [Candidatus Wallbacteria bacterium]|nr:hypothetical protein [Candidatus Wallbacteria bacterium]